MKGVRRYPRKSDPTICAVPGCNEARAGKWTTLCREHWRAYTRGQLPPTASPQPDLLERQIADLTYELQEAERTIAALSQSRVVIPADASTRVEKARQADFSIAFTIYANGIAVHTGHAPDSRMADILAHQWIAAHREVTTREDGWKRSAETRKRNAANAAERD